VEANVGWITLLGPDASNVARGMWKQRLAISARTIKRSIGLGLHTPSS